MREWVLYQSGCLLLLFIVWLLVPGLPVYVENRGESGHPCYFPDLRGKFCLSPLSVMFSVGFSCKVFIMLQHAPLDLLWWRFTNRCWTCQMFLLHLMKWSDDFYTFSYWCEISHWLFWILSYPSIPGINATRLWRTVFLIFCWIWFAHILLKTFASIFMRDNGLKR